MTPQLLELTRPFPDKYIHRNPSGGGDYIKHHVIEQRLIQVLGLPPAFRVVEVLRGDVAAIAPNPQGGSKRAREGAPALTAVVVGVIAEMSVSIGGERVTVAEAGDCEDPHNWPHDGGRLKDAMSDAYKRCAMRLGCGLHLWSQDEYFLFDQLSAEAEQSSGEVVGQPAASGSAAPVDSEPERASPDNLAGPVSTQEQAESPADEGEAPVSPSPPLNGKATAQQWENAASLYGSKAKVLFAYKEQHPGKAVGMGDITAQEMYDLIVSKAGTAMPR